MGSWDSFIGGWVKHEHFKSWPGKMFIVRAKEETNDKGSAVIIFDVQVNETNLKWQPNITAMKKLKELEFTSPLMLLGKHIIFGECEVYNPQTKKKQPGFEVLSVE